MCERENLSTDFVLLAMGLAHEVWSYSGCIVGGVRFHTVELDSRRPTQNSGVMVVDEKSASGSGYNNNFYGVLDEVLDVHYPMGRCVWLFMYRWYDTNNNISHRTHVKLGYKSINTSHF